MATKKKTETTEEVVEKAVKKTAAKSATKKLRHLAYILARPISVAGITSHSLTRIWIAL